jgi:hypothetical protein
MLILAIKKTISPTLQFVAAIEKRDLHGIEIHIVHEIMLLHFSIMHTSTLQADGQDALSQFGCNENYLKKIRMEGKLIIYLAKH